jgi:hypothetical protein
VPSLTNQNLNRTQKYKVIALKKIKKSSRTLQGGTLGGPSHEPKFKQDAKPRSKHSGEDVINNMSSFVK